MWAWSGAFVLRGRHRCMTWVQMHAETAAFRPATVFLSCICTRAGGEVAPSGGAICVTLHHSVRRNTALF